MACASRPELVAYFAPFVDEGTLFVPGCSPLARGWKGRLRLALATGAVVLEATAEAIDAHPHGGGSFGHPGVRFRLSAFESGSEAVFYELLQLRPDKTEADVDCAPPSPPTKPDSTKATARELEDFLDAWRTFRRAATHLLASRLRSWKATNNWLLVARRVSPPGLWLGLVPLAALAIGTVGWVRHQTAAPPAGKATATEATVTEATVTEADGTTVASGGAPKPALVAGRAPSPAPEPLASNPRCWARIESRPVGASLILDGRSLGPTPLDRVEIPCGQSTALLRHPRYETAQVSLVGRPDSPELVEARLVRPKTTLHLESEPEGAVFRVNGRSLPQHRRSTEVARFETVRVTATLAGHRTWQRRVYVRTATLALEARLPPRSARKRGGATK